MAVTLISETRLGPTTWLLTWSSNATPPVTYYVVRDGVLVGTTQLTSMQFEVVPGDDVAIGVYDAIGDISTSLPLSGRIMLFWTAVEGASCYQIRDGSGVTVDTVRSNGETIFRWTSQAQTDGVLAVFTVTPLSQTGIAGTPIPFTGRIVRTPPTPIVTYAWSKQATTGTITVAASG
jgi:hypothetical protein